MPEEKRSKEPGRPQISWWWWLLLFSLVIWNFTLFLPAKSPAETTLPYSILLDQIRLDNVKLVEIDGAQISGTFIKPVLWPQAPAPAVTQTVGQTASTTKTAAPVAYSAFVTNFPETVGDSSLMPLLETHNVQVEAKPASSPLLAIILTYGLPILLLVAVMGWIGRNASKSQSSIFNFGRSKARQYKGDHPGVTFKMWREATKPKPNCWKWWTSCARRRNTTIWAPTSPAASCWWVLQGPARH